MSVVFPNSERIFTNYPLSWVHPSIPCHLAPTRTPLLRPSSCPHFLDSENKRIRKCHSARSSQQHTWPTLPLSQELAKRIIPLHLLVKHFQNTKAKCPAWWHHYRASSPGRPQRQVGLSWAGHKSDSSQQHAGSGSSFLERCSVRTIALLLELIYQVRTKSGEVFGQLTAACPHKGIQIICYTSEL